MARKEKRVEWEELIGATILDVKLSPIFKLPILKVRKNGAIKNYIIDATLGGEMFLVEVEDK